MSVRQLTLDDLRRDPPRLPVAWRRASTSTATSSTSTFDDLGYDSLALLETSTNIEREFGVSLDDPTVQGHRDAEGAHGGRQRATGPAKTN